MRIYIAGKMSGEPKHNYPAFNAEAARLRALGYWVENPAENPAQDDWRGYMRLAIPQMLSCDAIALLPNWQRSNGAYLEWTIAMGLDMPVYPSHELQRPAA